MQQHHVSMTPLRLDLTDEEQLRQNRTRLGCSDDGIIAAEPALRA
jgi:hypothetical protein